MGRRGGALRLRQRGDEAGPAVEQVLLAMMVVHVLRDPVLRSASIVAGAMAPTRWSTQDAVLGNELHLGGLSVAAVDRVGAACVLAAHLLGDVCPTGVRAVAATELMEGRAFGPRPRNMGSPRVW